MTSRTESSLPAQLERMERARVVRDAEPRMRDAHITLSHGSGGKSSHALIESVILPAFRNPLLDGDADLCPATNYGHIFRSELEQRS